MLQSNLDFRIACRRDRLLGLWAAERIGLSGATAEAYARDVVQADLERPGDNDVVRKILRDFRMRHIRTTETEVRQEMNRLNAVARDQIQRSLAGLSP